MLVQVNLIEKWKKAKFGGKKRTIIGTMNISKTGLKTAANMVPSLIGPERQLGLIIYRLAHGCLFPVFIDHFGISKSLVTKILTTV